MITEKLNKILRIILIICLLLIGIMSIYYKFGDCDKCKFEINNTVYDSSEFMEIYSKKCFKPVKQLFELPKLK